MKGMGARKYKKGCFRCDKSAFRASIIRICTNYYLYLSFSYTQRCLNSLSPDKNSNLLRRGRINYYLIIYLFQKRENNIKEKSKKAYHSCLSTWGKVYSYCQPSEHGKNNMLGIYPHPVIYFFPAS